MLNSYMWLMATILDSSGFDPTLIDLDIVAGEPGGGELLFSVKTLLSEGHYLLVLVFPWRLKSACKKY